MKISRLEKDINGAEWMSAAIFVVGLLILSFIFVFANTNGVKTGIEILLIGFHIDYMRI